MYSFGEILNYIGRTNLFNFIIFFGIIVWVCKKINVSEKIESSRVSVVNSIEDSKTAKANSEEDLRKIEDSVSHIEEEIEKIIKKAESNAQMVGDKLLADAHRTVTSIKDNSQKSIEARAGLLKNDILKRASVASIEVAKSHIIEELKRNPDLHNRLIDESIDALDGVAI